MIINIFVILIIHFIIRSALGCFIYRIFGMDNHIDDYLESDLEKN